METKRDNAGSLPNIACHTRALKTTKINGSTHVSLVMGVYRSVRGNHQPSSIPVWPYLNDLQAVMPCPPLYMTVNVSTVRAFESQHDARFALSVILS